MTPSGAGTVLTPSREDLLGGEQDEPDEGQCGHRKVDPSALLGRRREQHQAGGRHPKEEPGPPGEPHRTSPLNGRHTSHAITTAPEILRTHAHTTLPATPQRTAHRRYAR